MTMKKRPSDAKRVALEQSSETAYCRNCTKVQPVAEFWDQHTRKRVKTCRTCLTSRRVKAKIRKGKQPSYFAYMNSTAWQEKRREWWTSDQPKNCYVCETLPRADSNFTTARTNA